MEKRYARYVSNDSATSGSGRPAPINKTLSAIALCGKLLTAILISPVTGICLFRLGLLSRCLDCHAEGERAYSIIQARSRPKRLGWFNSRQVLNRALSPSQDGRSRPAPISVGCEGERAYSSVQAWSRPKRLGWLNMRDVLSSGPPATVKPSRHPASA